MKSFKEFFTEKHSKIIESSPNGPDPSVEIDASTNIDFKNWKGNGPNPFEVGVETDPGDGENDMPWISVYGPEKFFMFHNMNMDKDFHDTFPDSAKKKIDDLEWDLKHELDAMNFEHMKKMQEVVQKYAKRIEEISKPHYKASNKFGLK